MSDEPLRLAEGMTPAPRDNARVVGHFCEHRDCGKVAGFGFARRHQESHWFCFAHKADGERYL